MALLLFTLGAAAALASVLPALGFATQNEGLMLAAFFACKAIWFVYLACLVEWLTVRVRQARLVVPGKARRQRRLAGL